MHNNGEWEVLNATLMHDYNALPVSYKKASHYEMPFNAGEKAWIFPTGLQHEGKELSFILKAASEYPFEVPDIYTYPALEMLKYPHVEKNGKLCVWPESKQFDPTCKYYFQELLKDAHQLVTDILNDKLTDDFTKGFNSYWNINTDPQYSILSLCETTVTYSREVYTHCANRTYIFSDDKEQLKTYLVNTGVKTNVKDQDLQKTFLLRIDTPWHPQDYPKNVNDIFSHLSSEVGEIKAAKLIYQANNNAYTASPCLLMVNTPNGVTVCGLMMTVNSSDKRIHKQRKELEGVGQGFRNGAMNALKNFIPRVKYKPVRQLRGQRIDPSWVLGRDCNSDISEFKNATVAVIGLGSVGSHLLPLLARSGVRNFVLIDSDIVETANIGRQWYGFHQIGKPKVSACSSEIIKQFPWINCKTYSLNWLSSQQAISDLSRADLIISATGSWSSDRALGQLSEQDELPPILWAFTESYGAATHAFYDPTGGFELERLFDETGGFSNSVASFNHETLKALPSCGGYFQSYGMGELSYGHAMISQLALSALLGRLSCEQKTYHIWVGDKHVIDANGGMWSPAFSDEHQWCHDGNCLIIRS
ncbi:ThiF family adenylyltransferase [Aeromonas salmonicida]|uniref:ThiF family adenylyltransferase n=1 Tax=Aeromonas salmonicida TaxID=645 RepID=UPI001788A5BF|nr:ThiF family adenylyltransferase [Aeromonas salmonicida]QOI95898.1 ThiF family adenylyltransferase [Aeromonas salmonicida subsp. masoucida]